MPIAPVAKVNNMLDNSIEATSHQRDRSVEDGPHSRLTELNRNSVGLNLPGQNQDKQEVIASIINSNQSKSPDRYVIGNSLVVTLDDSTVNTGSNGRGFQSQVRTA